MRFDLSGAPSFSMIIILHLVQVVRIDTRNIAKAIINQQSTITTLKLEKTQRCMYNIERMQNSMQL
jgi:hypothetical protein